MVAEGVFRGRHLWVLRQVIDERAEELGARRPLSHLPGEVLILLLALDLLS